MPLPIEPDPAALAQTCLARGDPQGAWTAATRGMAQAPSRADLCFLAGVAALQLGALREAAEALRRALALQPRLVEARANLGRVLELQGELAQSAECYRAAIALQPAMAVLHTNLGSVLARLEQAEEAQRCFNRALDLDAGQPGALANLGWLRYRRGEVEAGRKLLERAIVVAPGHVLGRYNLACVCSEQGETALAEHHYREVLRLDPRFKQAWFNLGYLLADRGSEQEAAACYERVLALDPAHADAQVNLAWILLAHGDYARGLALYEARHRSQLAADSAPPQVVFPEWQGEDLTGRSILIWPEMRLGDEVVMARFGPELKKRGATRVTLVCKSPLQPLFATLPQVDEVLSIDEARGGVPAHDCWALQASLPWRLGVSPTRVPADLPYLAAAPARIDTWRRRLPENGIRVGLVWKGSGGMLQDPRSLAHLSELAPLWEVAGVRFVSLQKGRGEDEAAAPPPDQPLLHLGSDIADFADTAAILEQLDLLISVDSAVVHVAGALGKACWVLVPAARAFWLWGRQGDTTPWYGPNLRLFRQAPGEAWSECILRLRDALQEWRAKGR
ncbi:TPR repeat-containing protein YrrB [Burkholderiales bacterium]|nr:TPR repeat-containing protein YrrB [Burkholderiales bacterium]